MSFTGLGRAWYNPAFQTGDLGMYVTDVNDKKVVCVTKSGNVEAALLSYEEEQ